MLCDSSETAHGIDIPNGQQLGARRCSYDSSTEVKRSRTMRSSAAPVGLGSSAEARTRELADAARQQVSTTTRLLAFWSRDDVTKAVSLTKETLKYLASSTSLLRTHPTTFYADFMLQSYTFNPVSNYSHTAKEVSTNSSPEAFVRELLHNSYDADATWVRMAPLVGADPQAVGMVAADNGHGMTRPHHVNDEGELVDVRVSATFELYVCVAKKLHAAIKRSPCLRRASYQQLWLLV